MSLAAMLAAHDTVALTALASKGLMRRAERDLQAGAGTITARTDDEATVETDGQIVQIGTAGPAAAQCTCPASGVCRHILLAVLILQAAAPPSAPSGDAPKDVPDDRPEGAPTPAAAQTVAPPPAAGQIAALDEAVIRKFGGADWAPAQKIASQGAMVDDTGSTCTVTPSGSDVSISFISGQGLDGAVYKGPRTRRRVFVTAAALAVRARAGVAISAAATVQDEPALDPAFCDAVADTIEMAVTGTMTGSADIAADNLFDRAVSARAGAAPRLAAQLRGLSNMALLAAGRDAGFSAAAFVESAARCYALALALKAAPNDPALSGVIARTYRDGDPLDLWVMGSSRWRTATGARGLTVHCFDAGAGRWYTQVTARGAGMDLGFDPRGAYSASLWGAGSPASLKGTRLHLAQPRVSDDNQIAATLAHGATRLDGTLSEAALADMAVRDWSAFNADIAGRRGRGLRRVATPLPALIRPARIGDLTFDDFAQVYRMDVADRGGDTIELQIEAEDETLAPALHAARSAIAALLVEVSAGPDGWRIRPVTAMLKDAGTLRTVDLGFERIGRHRTLAARLTKLQDKMRRYVRRTPTESDRMMQLCDATMDALIDALGVPVTPDRLIARLQNAGLATLADATVRAARTRAPREILSAAYLTAELRMTLA